MWSYYGSKTQLAHLYPPPKYGKIIEPFAGSARYALRYFDRDVLLVDKYEPVARLWKWLQQCSEKDVLETPLFKFGENIQDYPYDCEERYYLVAFLHSFGSHSVRNNSTPRIRERPNSPKFTRDKIAASLYKIRHWEIRHGSYESIENEEATWFIDPPYFVGGHSYPCSNKKIDYQHLGKWSMERSGQVIVCENMKADWLPFKPMTSQFTLRGEYHEAIWSNLPIAQDQHQTSLIS